MTEAIGRKRHRNLPGFFHVLLNALKKTNHVLSVSKTSENVDMTWEKAESGKLTDEMGGFSGFGGRPVAQELFEF
jgi:hypothetical protein